MAQRSELEEGMIHRFKAGDKVVRLPKYGKHWPKSAFTVKGFSNFANGLPAIV
jgi:hypothetical protein